MVSWGPLQHQPDDDQQRDHQDHDGQRDQRRDQQHRQGPIPAGDRVGREPGLKVKCTRHFSTNAVKLSIIFDA